MSRCHVSYTSQLELGWLGDSSFVSSKIWKIRLRKGWTSESPLSLNHCGIAEVGFDSLRVLSVVLCFQSQSGKPRTFLVPGRFRGKFRDPLNMLRSIWKEPPSFHGKTMSLCVLLGPWTLFLSCWQGTDRICPQDFYKLPRCFLFSTEASLYLHPYSPPFHRSELTEESLFLMLT